MDELVNQITQRTGISQNQAQQAVQVTVNFLKQKLPPQIASQVENYIGGQGGKGMGGTMGQSQGMFGGNQPGVPPR
jgi:hypothetical protein